MSRVYTKKACRSSEASDLFGRTLRNHKTSPDPRKTPIWAALGLLSGAPPRTLRNHEKNSHDPRKHRSGQLRASDASGAGSGTTKTLLIDEKHWSGQLRNLSWSTKNTDLGSSGASVGRTSLGASGTPFWNHKTSPEHRKTLISAAPELLSGASPQAQLFETTNLSGTIKNTDLDNSKRTFEATKHCYI